MKTTLKSALVLCLVASITVAPVSYAAEAIDATPLNYDFVFSVDNGDAELAFKRVENGYLFWSLKGLQQTPRLLTDREIAAYSPKELTGNTRYRAAFPDGFGGTHDYWIVPDLHNNGLTGRVETVGTGGVSRSYAVRFAQNPGSDRDRDTRFAPKSNVVVIVLGAAAVGAIACAFNAWITDCAGDCADACGSSGMLSSSEGTCGGCTCTCK